VGARIPAAQVGEQELAAYKEMELQRVNDSLDQYLHLCAQGRVCCSASPTQLIMTFHIFIPRNGETAK
jgi:hypothetical protein